MTQDGQPDDWPPGTEHRTARMNLAGRFLAHPEADHFEDELIYHTPMSPFRAWVVINEFSAANWITEGWSKSRRIWRLTPLGKQMMLDLLEQTTHGG